jgi:Domain of unknown function (DUF5668)
MVTSDRPPVLTPQVAVGVTLALAGIIFTLDNLGLADAGLLLRFWPAIPILVGVMQVMHAREPREWIVASLWLGVGGILLARNLGALQFSVRDFLPLILVLVGIRLVMARNERGREAKRTAGTPGLAPGPAPASDPWHEHFDRRTEEPVPDVVVPPPIPPGAVGPTSRLQIFAMMCGVERRVRGLFVGAEASAIMGGCELDLRQATPAADTMHLSAFALWGGIEIRVPETWIVLNESMALLGGVDDATRNPGVPGSPHLIVRGFALMGGIEIKN